MPHRAPDRETLVKFSIEKSRTDSASEECAEERSRSLDLLRDKASNTISSVLKSQMEEFLRQSSAAIGADAYAFEAVITGENREAHKKGCRNTSALNASIVLYSIGCARFNSDSRLLG